MKNKIFITNCILALLGTLSALFCFFTAFSIPIKFWDIAPFCFCSMVIFGFCHQRLSKKKSNLLLFLFFLLLVLSGFLLKDIINNSLYAITYYFRETLMNTQVLADSIQVKPSSPEVTLVALFRYLSVCLTYFMFLFFTHCSFLLLPLLFTIPLVEIALFFGAVPSYFPFFLYLLFFILHIGNWSIHRKTKKHAPSSFTPFLASCFLISFILALAYLQTSDFKRPKRWDEMRVAVIRQDYGTLVSYLGNSFGDYIPSSRYSGVSGGNLSFLGNKKKSNITALEVTLSESDQTLYLKGYVGSHYYKNHWNELNKEQYEDKIKRYTDFQKKDSPFLSPLLLQSYLSIQDLQFQDTITILPRWADKDYAYTPYTLLPTDDLTEVKDLYYRPKSKDSYTLSYAVASGEQPFTFQPIFAEPHLSSFSSAYDDNSFDYLDNLIELSQIYKNYVQDTCLILPTDLYTKLKPIAEQIMENADYQKENYPEELKKYLSKYLYTLTPGSAPFDEDINTYFLIENKKGYCVHFASSASLLLRCLGIPSRYVEGYIITPANIRSGFYNEDTKQYTVLIPESNAHAWTEYYMEDYGWIPLEVTPAYTSASNFAFQNSTQPPQPSDEINTPQNSYSATSSSSAAENIDADSSNTTSIQPPQPSYTSQENQMESRNFLLFLLKIIQIILLLALIPLLLLYRRCRLLLKRMSKFSQEDNNLSAREMFTFLDYLRTLSPFTRSESFLWESRIVPIMQLVYYSQHSLTDKQLLELSYFLHSFEGRIYDNLTPIQRIRYCLLTKYPLEKNWQFPYF